MQFRATAHGTIGKGAAVRRVRPGEVFELAEGVIPGKWMVPVEPVEAPKPKRAAKPKAEPDPVEPDPADEPI
jgi:hypothetical protein